jgi:hypothetical protein
MIQRYSTFAIHRQILTFCKNSSKFTNVFLTILSHIAIFSVFVSTDIYWQITETFQPINRRTNQWCFMHHLVIDMWTTDTILKLAVQTTGWNTIILMDTILHRYSFPFKCYERDTSQATHALRFFLQNLSAISYTSV